jgi:hypothetical protein
VRFAAVKRGETRLRRGALTMSALCRLVLQLRTYRCIAADDATGHLQTRALQKGFAETFAFQRQETFSLVAPTTGETGTVVQPMSGRGAAIPASAVLKASEPFRIGPPSTDLPIEA